MAKIEDLIDEIADPVLRERIANEAKELKETKRFGLVFEEHIPETVSLYGLPIRAGLTVQNRTTPDDLTEYQILRVDGEKATLVPKGADEPEITVDASDLLVVKRFHELIFPGLTPVGEVRRGADDKPAHVVINGENFHALQLLTYSHAGVVDCIYIDPPYNTGARDWKYNNRFVDENDSYRHSKWLAFMRRRLLMAKRLLRPDRSVLLVTIDEKEVHRLGLLLDDVFPGYQIQMLTSVINPKGASLGRDFARVDEHIFVVYIGDAAVGAEVRDMLDEAKNAGSSRSVKWSSLIRGGAKGIRTDSPGAYYPVFVDPSKPAIHSFGDALPWDGDKDAVVASEGTIAVWPPAHTSGVEGRWGIGPEKAAELLARGALRLGNIDVSTASFPMSYLTAGIMEKVDSGEIETVGRRQDGALIVRYPPNTKVTQPKTVWNMKSHNAGEYGSKMLTALLPGRRFPFPKSLYSVEDLLRFFIGDQPEAVVLDFFAGSGTTAHAVLRLNRQDGGSRRSILVTNNEVSSSEAKSLMRDGHRPGDAEWEALGVFEYLTKPRLEAAVSGMTPDGDPISGDYKFVEGFPMAEGFDENIVFCKIDYLEPDTVELGRQFDAIAPMLWMTAGSVGEWEEWDGVSSWSLPETSMYGVLFDEDHLAGFVEAVAAHPSITHIWLVTNSPAAFAEMRQALPEGLVEVRQLYRDYLRNFTINAPGVLRR